MTAWEYKVIRLDPYRDFEHSRQLDENGKLGWELVSIFKGTAYLKRLIQINADTNASLPPGD